MPLDTKEAARRVVEDSQPGRLPLWQQDVGVRARTVRWDLPLRQSAEILHVLRWLGRELPNICERIERENDEDRRLFVAQTELQRVRAKTTRRRL